MEHAKLKVLDMEQLLQKRIELYSDCSPEQRAVIDLHFRKKRMERAKTEALVWSIWLACAVLVATIVWASYVRFCPRGAEEQFYSAACKLSDADMPRTVLAECAARNIN
ncbi:hypothetical protein [Pseudomonas sp. R9.37]|uniref:hypothetical protein n=1 Tax=Pseudomonas sp. R9.37 TaxID=1390498 RepID=UPI000D0D5FE7|nr:hypothetical protein [Pseudomonas sp. R9.37]PSL90782.1 hypothetical protein C7U57_28625 [Pseudomonas sp. R9.37]